MSRPLRPATPETGEYLEQMVLCLRAARRYARLAVCPATMRKIRELNDALRTTMTGGKVLLTAGVDALPSDVKALVIRKVATFSEFTPDNDPYGEHDFGSFEFAGHKFFWKIDYYDPTMQFGSEDPADPSKTARVLTIMLAEEY